MLARDTLSVIDAGESYLKKGMASESTPSGHQISATRPPSLQGMSKGSELLSIVRNMSYVTSCPQAMNRVLCVETEGSDDKNTSVITSLRFGRGCQINPIRRMRAKLAGNSKDGNIISVLANVQICHIHRYFWIASTHLADGRRSPGGVNAASA